MKLHVQTLFVAIGLGIKRNWHIFLAIIAGIFFGNYLNTHPEVFQPVLKVLNIVGQAFIRIIQININQLRIGRNSSR